VSQQFFLVDAEEQAKVAYVEALDMIFLRQWREVPSLKPTFAELNRLNSLKLSLCNELLNLLLSHAVVLVIEKLDLNLHGFLVLLIFFFFRKGL
jgi:hypothetical protein